MVRVWIFLAASFAAADDRCCYSGCGAKPTGCNNPGEYCNSQANCGGCGGEWCPDSPGPSPPSPSPPPSPTPPSPGAVYCPTADDLVVAYGDGVEIEDGGWSIQGDGGAASKAAFNLLGGFVEFDFDVSNANTGVIPNIYTVSPDGIGGGFTQDSYCDDGENDKPDCLEVDWLEANGGCGGATTLHTVSGTGEGACNYWGCRSTYHFGGSTFHMKVEYGQDGKFSITRDGQQISGDSLQPPASGSDWGIVSSTYQSKGGVIYSSQWTGSWVPADFCGGGPGDLGGSHFKISNLQISGTVVQGPEPSKCSSPTPTPTPTPPTPTPTPTPSPSPSTCSCGCTGDDLKACVEACPSAKFEQCVQTCESPCASSCTGGDDGSSLHDCVAACPTDGFQDCVACCSNKFPSATVV